MVALQTRAEADGDVAAAEEADRLASGIARQQMTYKDIKTRREAIKNLLQRLRPRQSGGGGAPAES
jgi:hypothetical protein